MSDLVIPLDATQVAAAEREQQGVRVAVRDAGGKITSQVVKVGPGKAEARLRVDGKQSLTVAVGPENVSDEELFNLQTINTQISP
ncbi:MAG: hypothetical protein JO360_06515, partial [Acidobacteria bacterium]|nr:hypothetical protein [Acidobacteriota bacterium]